MNWPPFGSGGDYLYHASGDPAPNSPGLWLGTSVTPNTCFNDRTPNVVDADKDWLDDNCEYHLAKAFAPVWGMSIDDGCPQAEPVWAAKYFEKLQIVRLAYMPAYHNDCGGGTAYDHHGDSEFVMVEVMFNHTTQHWEFRVMFTSSHYGTPNDGSRWTFPPDITFTKRHLAHPMVYIAERKHANYAKLAWCGNGTVNYDECQPFTPYFRFPVEPGRNAGSRFVPLVGCVQSAINPNPGLTECWYTQGNGYFCGWQGYAEDPWGVDCAPSHNQWLTGGYFEWYHSDPGPGPIRFEDLDTSPRMFGPTSVNAGDWNTWWVEWEGHTLTSCTWKVNFTVVQTGSCYLDRSFASAGTYDIRATATRSDGQSQSAGRIIVTVN